MIFDFLEMNFWQLRGMASHVTDGTHKKGALRNELLLKTLQPKRQHFPLNVPYPVIYRTPHSLITE